jgi:choline dehydrogenase-like flavoprotein
LTPNFHRKHLTVITQTQVEKVVINDGIATGVRYKHRGKVQQSIANHQVTLSASAIHSPQILMLCWCRT